MPPATYESDGYQVFREANDLLNQLAASETNLGGAAEILQLH